MVAFQNIVFRNDVTVHHFGGVDSRCSLNMVSMLDRNAGPSEEREDSNSRSACN